MISLRHKLKYMLGVGFDRVKHMQDGAAIAHGWYVFIGFYWFCLVFYKDWPVAVRPSCSMYGVAFSYKPAAKLKEGDLMWEREKRLIRYKCRKIQGRL